VRRDRSLVPDRFTRLEAGDQLLVVTTAEVRAVAEARLRSVSRGGKLAGWLRSNSS
jgi:cell volume regulation protein A